MILHVTGPHCAGKTYIIERFLKKRSVAVWDVLNFYERFGFIRDNTIYYSNWRKIFKEIKSDLKGFIEENAGAKMIIVESSGTNQHVNELLMSVSQDGISVRSVMLNFPTDEELTVRASKRGVPIQKAKEINNSIRSVAKGEGIDQDRALNLMHQVYDEL